MYRAIYQRRDIRNFRADPISDRTLARIINAAHHGPSVGFMQPWDFILVRDVERRRQVKELFERERASAACFFDEPRRSSYLSLKLEGILEAPVNLCITCDPTRAGVVLGRNSMPETDVYSTCCAVQNLWLAARQRRGWSGMGEYPEAAPTARDIGHTAAHHSGGLSFASATRWNFRRSRGCRPPAGVAAFPLTNWSTWTTGAIRTMMRNGAGSWRRWIWRRVRARNPWRNLSPGPEFSYMPNLSLRRAQDRGNLGPMVISPRPRTRATPTRSPPPYQVRGRNAESGTHGDRQPQVAVTV